MLNTGLAYFNIASENLFISSLPQCISLSGNFSLVIIKMTSFSLSPNVAAFCSILTSRRSGLLSSFLENFCQSLDIFPFIQFTISLYTNFTSSPGSCLFSDGLPSRSVMPEASKRLIIMSASRTLSRNSLPIPFPSLAPSINPGTSIISTGIYLIPSTHLPSRGLHLAVISFSGHLSFINEMPTLGLIVVKG
ncbi:MAG: hypothetical protein AMDU4_FER2C00007G0001 [Ferroplasma sp. Type II]|nr:MAG: hypothetical protein AMDU4_FER2C00007G0001 [Ferroplasma sp. Type II]